MMNAFFTDTYADLSDEERLLAIYDEVSEKYGEEDGFNERAFMGAINDYIADVYDAPLDIGDLEQTDVDTLDTLSRIGAAADNVEPTMFPDIDTGLEAGGKEMDLMNNEVDQHIDPTDQNINLDVAPNNLDNVEQPDDGDNSDKVEIDFPKEF